MRANGFAARLFFAGVVAFASNPALVFTAADRSSAFSSSGFCRSFSLLAFAARLANGFASSAGAAREEGSWLG